MKAKFYIWFFIGVLFLSIPAFGQKTVVVVQPDTGLNIGALNNAINSAANPGNTIFELKRGGLYLLNGTVSHTGYTLHIRAEAGTGACPILQPGVDALGVSSYHFGAGASIILEGLYIYGLNELGAFVGNAINVTGTGNRTVINNCYLDYSNASFVYLSSINNRVFITNSICRNATQPANASNGRVIDARGNPQDTLVIKNSTIYNVSAKTISGPGYVGYMDFSNNTSFRCNLTSVFALGGTVDCHINNNIFYDYCLRGARNSPTHTLFTIDSIYTVGSKTDADRHFDMRNNNWYQEPQYMEYILEYTPKPGDTNYKDDMLYTFALSDTEKKDKIWYTEFCIRKHLFNQPIYDTIVNNPYFPDAVTEKWVKSGQIDTANFISESLSFKNPPPFFADYWKFQIQNHWSIKGTNPPNAYADEDLTAMGEVKTGAFDFSYNTGSKSAKGGIGGLPLGDPRWTPFSTVSVEDIETNKLNTVKTYPNPANQQITFEIKSEESTSVKIILSDLLGKQLMMVEKQLVSGNNSIFVDLKSISRTGIYLYQIQFESSNGKKSITSGKFVKK